MSARESIEDPRFDRLQLRIQELEKRASLCPFFDGRKVIEQTIGTGSTPIAHGLNRTPRGFIVLSVTPDAAIGISSTPPIDSTKFINLEASSSATADLWFF